MCSSVCLIDQLVCWWRLQESAGCVAAAAAAAAGGADLLPWELWQLQVKNGGVAGGMHVIVGLWAACG
jgi:hypothetical protein